MKAQLTRPQAQGGGVKVREVTYIVASSSEAMGVSDGDDSVPRLGLAGTSRPLFPVLQYIIIVIHVSCYDVLTTPYLSGGGGVMPLIP